MRGPTPEQQRKTREAYESVGKYWYTDLATQELRRKPLTGLRWVINIFWKKRHTLWEFYWWLAYRRAQEDMIIYGNPIQSDNMPLKGFPVKCELQGGWTIPRCDLKYLTHGPLASEGLGEILVPASIGWRSVWEFVRQFAAVLGAVTAFASFVVKFGPEISEIALRLL